jgi:dihydroorotase
VEELKKALADGTIDAIATDHAPHHEKEKGVDFYKAANGISGIETAFSVCFTELVIGKLLSLRQLVQKMSYNPAKLLKLDAGVISEGKPADIVLADLNQKIIINKSDMVSQGKNTPFHNRSYMGKVRYTIAAGKTVYKG